MVVDAEPHVGDRVTPVGRHQHVLHDRVFGLQQRLVQIVGGMADRPDLLLSRDRDVAGAIKGDRPTLVATDRCPRSTPRVSDSSFGAVDPT